MAKSWTDEDAKFESGTWLESKIWRIEVLNQREICYDLKGEGIFRNWNDINRDNKLKRMILKFIYLKVDKETYTY